MGKGREEWARPAVGFRAGLQDPGERAKGAAHLRVKGLQQEEAGSGFKFSVRSLLVLEGS